MTIFDNYFLMFSRHCAFVGLGPPAVGLCTRGLPDRRRGLVRLAGTTPDLPLPARQPVTSNQRSGRKTEGTQRTFRALPKKICKWILLKSICKSLKICE